MEYERDTLSQFAYSLLLFLLGAFILGHGVAVVVLSREVPSILTFGLPFLGALIAYQSFLRHVPSWRFSSDKWRLVLAFGTALFVNLSVPGFYEFISVFRDGTLGIATGYWNVFLAGVAGFVAIGCYKIITSEVSEKYAFWQLLGAAVLSVVAAGILLVTLSTRLFPVVSLVKGLPPIAGATLMAFLFDYADVQAAPENEPQ